MNRLGAYSPWMKKKLENISFLFSPSDTDMCLIYFQVQSLVRMWLDRRKYKERQKYFKEHVRCFSKALMDKIK